MLFPCFLLFSPMRCLFFHSFFHCFSQFFLLNLKVRQIKTWWNANWSNQNMVIVKANLKSRSSSIKNGPKQIKAKSFIYSFWSPEYGEFWLHRPHGIRVRFMIYFGYENYFEKLPPWKMFLKPDLTITSQPKINPQIKHMWSGGRGPHFKGFGWAFDRLVKINDWFTFLLILFFPRVYTSIRDLVLWIAIVRLTSSTLGVGYYFMAPTGRVNFSWKVLPLHGVEPSSP